MSRIAYVNGRYLPLQAAEVHVEDRGFQFADGVYEVVAIVDGRFIDESAHLDRLDRSLAALAIPAPMPRRALQAVLRSVATRNGVTDGLVYLQVTRGAAPRDFKFPKHVRPTLVAYARRKSVTGVLTLAAKGVSCISVPDIRWKRCDIKSVGLLAACLAKQKAAEAGAFEAWQVDERGMVTEGSSSNAWIVTAEGTLVTREPSNALLNGITRCALIDVAAAMGIPFMARSFSLEEAYAAREAFVSSATSYVMPVIRLDGRPIGEGKVGPLCTRLLSGYMNHAEHDGTPVRHLPPLAAWEAHGASRLSASSEAAP